MRFHTYIYGRTLKIDFRDICAPLNGLPPTSASLVKELINTDAVSNGDIKRLRYLFVREQSQVLFGIGFNHRQYLAPELHTDISGKRGLRSFVGIIIDRDEFDNLSSIPTDPAFFIDLYLKHISTVWELEDRQKNRKIIASELAEQEPLDSWGKLDGYTIFNVDENLCRYFSPTEEYAILRSLKNCLSSVAIGLNVESHVTTAFRRFKVSIPNAVCMDTQATYDYELSPGPQEGKGEESKGDSKLNRYETSTISADKNGNAKNAQVHRKNINDLSSFEPVILSGLERKKPSGNPHRKDELLNENLMSIDWGDDNQSEPLATTTEEKHSKTFDTGISEKQDLHTGLLVNNEDDTDRKPKKVYRPEFVMGVIALILSIFAICMLTTKCQQNVMTTPSPSTSGDTIKLLQNK